MAHVSFVARQAYTPQLTFSFAARVAAMLVRSDLKTVLFLLFQMCQQHRSKKVVKNFLGMLFVG
jgi:hypothetical protein